MTAHADLPAPAVSPRRRGAGDRVQVRPATVGDLDAIVAMRLRLLGEEGRSALFADPHPEAAARARHLTALQLNDLDQVFLLAVVGGSPVGVLRCAMGSGSPMLRDAVRGVLSTAWVDPAHRRQGVLRALVDAALQWCAERDVHDLRLHVTRENAEGNAAWEALGFEVVEVVRRRRR